MHLFFIWFLRAFSAVGIVAVAKSSEDSSCIALGTILNLFTLAASFVLR